MLWSVTQHFFPGFVACRRGTPKWAGVKRRGLSALGLRTGSYNRTKQAWRNGGDGFHAPVLYWA